MSCKIKQDISIGDNLKRLRQNQKLTQEEVAAKLQLLGLPMSREILSQMEAGKYSIRVSVLVALKKLYQATYADFFADLDGPEHKSPVPGEQ